MIYPLQIKRGKHTLKDTVATPGGIQQINFIPESDLFRLIVKSKLPYAEKFEKWVFEDILPSIRARGIYATLKVVDEGLNDPSTIRTLLNELKITPKVGRAKTKNQIS